MRPQASYYYQMRYRTDTDYNDEIRRKRGVAIQALEMVEEGKTLQQVCQELRISDKKLTKALGTLSDIEKEELKKARKQNRSKSKEDVKPNSKPMSREKFSAYVRSRASKK